MKGMEIYCLLIVGVFNKRIEFNKCLIDLYDKFCLLCKVKINVINLRDF